MSKNNRLKKFLLTMIFLLSIAIASVYIWGIYYPEMNTEEGTPTRETDNVR